MCWNWCKESRTSCLQSAELLISNLIVYMNIMVMIVAGLKHRCYHFVQVNKTGWVFVIYCPTYWVYWVHCTTKGFIELRRKKKLFVCPWPPAHIFLPTLNFFSYLFLIFNFMTKLAVFSRQNLMIAVISFSLLCTMVLTIPSSYMLCTISLWTMHLVDFPATIAETVGQYCVWTVKKKSSARPSPFSNLCGGQTNNIFFAL